MSVEQALVAVGGKASRLRAGGREVPVSKPFLELEGNPLLHWSLENLSLAGIQRVVITGDSDEQLTRSQEVVSSLVKGFDEVVYFKDGGKGAHGLPYQTKHLFDSDATFLSECGHNISPPDHIEQMSNLKRPDSVVFSAYTPHPDNPRQPVMLSGDTLSLPSADLTTHRNIIALAHPLLVDQDYANLLPELNFDINAILKHYIESGLMSYIHNKLPPEFDIVSEQDAAFAAYRKYLGMTATHVDHV